MNEIITIIIAIAGFIISGVIGFFTAKLNVNNKINELKLEVEKLRSRDDLQQKSIEEIEKLANQVLPLIIKQLEKKEKDD